MNSSRCWSILRATRSSQIYPVTPAVTSGKSHLRRERIDIRAEKRFELGGTRRLSVTLNVYNLLNANSPLGVQGRSGPQFGFVTSIPPGRLVEAALRVGF